MPRPVFDTGQYSVAAAVAKPLSRPSDVVMERNASNRKKLASSSFKLAKERLDENDLEGAIEHMAMCCSACPLDSRYFHRRGLTFAKLSKHLESHNDFVTCTTLEPENAVYQSALGSSLKALGRSEEAIQAYSRAIDLDPATGEYFTYRGDVHMILKQFEKAIENYNEAIGLLNTSRNIFHPYVGRGKSFRALGQLQLAIKDFGVAKDIRPNNTDTMLLQGQTYMEAEDWLNAIDCLNKALKIDPKHANLHDQLGEGCIGCAYSYRDDKLARMKVQEREGATNLSRQQIKNLSLLEAEHLQAAEDCFNKAISLEPEEPEFLFHRGKLFLHQKMYEPALDDFQRAARLGGPNLVEYLFHVGHTYAIIGEQEYSIIAYRKAVMTDSTHKESLIKLGRALHLTGEFNQAANMITSAISMDKDNPEIHHVRGCIFRDMMDFEKSLKDLNIAYKSMSEVKEVSFHMGQALLGLKRYAEAHEAFDRALKLGYSLAEVQNWKGMVYQAQENWEEADSAYTVALGEEPEEPKYYFNRAICAKLSGRLEAALEDFSEALLYDPGCVEYLHNRGVVLAKLHRYRGALADLTASQSGLDPEDEEEAVAAGWYWTGVSHAGLKQWGQAVEALTKGALVRPTYAQIFHERAKALQNSGIFDEAMNDFDRVIELQPRNSHAYFRRGFIWKEKKNYERAAEDFEAAKALNPDNPVIWLDYNSIGHLKLLELARAGEEEESDPVKQDDVVKKKNVKITLENAKNLLSV